MKEILIYVFTVILMSIIYMCIKSFLSLFMSDNLSWVGLSLLLTYVIYDIIKMKSGTKE